MTLRVYARSADGAGDYEVFDYPGASADFDAGVLVVIRWREGTVAMLDRLAYFAQGYWTRIEVIA